VVNIPSLTFARPQVFRRVGGADGLKLARKRRKRHKMARIHLQIRVKPNARVSSLVQMPDNTWHAKLKSPPVDGRANEELVALVAKHFNCRKTAVSIKTGAAGRSKLVTVEM
jgi:uncharacterized protein (TIGR00251 family)